VADGSCTPEQIAAFERESQAEVNEAVAAARMAPFPAVEDLTLGTY
jgi:hypothetical protein